MAKKNAKEATSHLFNRYVWLADLIFRRKEISFKEIDEAWQNSGLNYSGEPLPHKTFQNHKDALQEMFQIVIECTHGAGYKYYIDNSEDIQRGGVRKWLINTFALNNLINESHKIKNRILFEQVPSGQEYLTAIIDAMRNNICLEMTYQGFAKSQPSTFVIEPYFVKVFKQRWYVIANSIGRDQLRVYSLDRIKDLKNTEIDFRLSAEFDPETYFADCFGIIKDDNTDAHTVEIKVSRYTANYIKSLPLHTSQREIENCAEYTVFSYFISPTLDFQQQLLSHGAELEVLKPQWLRDKFLNTYKWMIEIYNG